MVSQRERERVLQNAKVWTLSLFHKERERECHKMLREPKKKESCWVMTVDNRASKWIECDCRGASYLRAGLAKTNKNFSYFFV